MELHGSSKEKYIETLKDICKNLPKHNKNVLYEIIVFIRKVADQSEKNRMNHSNLAIVFGMNIIKPMKDDPLKMIEDCKKINYATEILFENFEEIMKKE